jgi:hypothetical protein
MIKIRAYRYNDYEAGESIVLHAATTAFVCAAADIDDLISKLTQAKEYAIKSAVGDEVLELEF